MPQLPATSTEALLRQALAAIDTCVRALTQVDEQVDALARSAEAEQRAIQDVLGEIDAATLNPALREYLTSLNAQAYSIDHNAIHDDELTLRQELPRLRSLSEKVDHLIRLMRIARVQVQGEPDSEEASPWEAAVRTARIEAQEEERKRLAREIHDGPAQVMANAILRLEYCEMIAARAPEELDGELRRLRTMMQEGLVEVRRFMFDLRPPMLASMGLIATLRRYIDEYHHAFGITVHLEAPSTDPAVDDHVQMGLFRVIQESLQNVQKHAQASEVRVVLGYGIDGDIHLTIHDNGRGFDPEAVRPTRSSGAGLVGMAERARMLGGTLSVTSSPEAGATVSLHLPRLPLSNRPDSEARSSVSLEAGG